MSSRRRVVFLSICSGDPGLIAQWTSSGDLPVIEKLLRAARIGTTTGLPGVFVGAHWPSFITGCHPGKNRVHSWQQIEPGTYHQYRCFAGDHMQRRPFWDYLSDAGCRICVLDIPHSKLSPDINGIQTVEWGAHDGTYGFRASSESINQALGAILDDLDDDTTVILLANHGIGPKYNAQHLLDRALVALGYAAPAVAVPRPRTWRDAVDPSLSRAWQALRASMRSALAPLRDLKHNVVNLAGREPRACIQPGSQYEKLLAAISHDLYPEPERSLLPDLFVEWTNDAPVNAIGSDRLPRLEGQYRYIRSGEQRATRDTRSRHRRPTHRNGAMLSHA